MILIVLSLYFVECGISYEGNDTVYIHNVNTEIIEDTLVFSKEKFYRNLYYPKDGSGWFTFSTETDSSIQFYRYSLPENELKKLYTMYRAKEGQSYISVKGKEIHPSYNFACLSDTLLLMGVMTHYGEKEYHPPAYILYINYEKNKVNRMIKIPEELSFVMLGPANKEEGLITFSISASWSSENVITYIMDINSGELRKINKGYQCAKDWINDSLLLFSDAKDYLEENRKPHEKTIQPSWDYFLLNINNGEKNVIKDDCETLDTYVSNNKIYFVYFDGNLIKDVNGKVIQRHKLDFHYNYIYNRLISYPEDTEIK